MFVVAFLTRLLTVREHIVPENREFNH